MKDIQAVHIAEFGPDDGLFLGTPNAVFWNSASIKTTKIGFPGIRTEKNALGKEKRRDEAQREELTPGHE
jgi:hypothetical protein